MALSLLLLLPRWTIVLKERHSGLPTAFSVAGAGTRETEKRLSRNSPHPFRERKTNFGHPGKGLHDKTITDSTNGQPSCARLGAYGNARRKQREQRLRVGYCALPRPKSRHSPAGGTTGAGARLMLLLDSVRVIATQNEEEGSARRNERNESAWFP